MKIFICNRPGGAFGYITDGWVNALRKRGHDVRRWDGLEQSWRAFGPNLYIGCSGHKQPIPLDNSCKIAIHVNPYGPVNIEGINESEENIRWVLRQKPHAVFGYGHEEDRLLWSYWTKNHSIPWVPMPCAGDSVLFSDSIPQNDRQYDIVYLGGRWAYKGKTIDAYLLPALRHCNKHGLKTCVRGWGDWPTGVCSGVLPEDESNLFLNDGRVGPCISEIHTHNYGIDIPERVFKLALAGTLPIHDPVPVIKRYLPSVVVAQNTQNFADLCRHYAEHHAEREQKIKQVRDEVLSAHTYFHRMSTLFLALGFKSEAEEMIS